MHKAPRSGRFVFDGRKNYLPFIRIAKWKLAYAR